MQLRLKPQELLVLDGSQGLKILDEPWFVTGTRALDAGKVYDFFLNRESFRFSCAQGTDLVKFLDIIRTRYKIKEIIS